MKPARTIEEYLDQLADELEVEPRRLQRILREAEDHLRSSTQRLVEQGLPRADAELVAIERFGSTREVARGFKRVSGRQFTRFAPALCFSITELVIIGFLTIGLSGVLSFGLSRAFGQDFVAGDLAGVSYSTARCADFFSFHPEAGSCGEAATAHHLDEVVDMRLGAGLIGLLGLVPLFASRRLLPRPGSCSWESAAG